MTATGKHNREFFPGSFPGSGHNHARCVDAALGAAAKLCGGGRLTPLRRRVLEIVWSSHQPIGAYAILDQLKTGARSAAPPTVYRALEFLLEHGLIHRIESLNAFVGCARPGDNHLAHFLLCTRCGTAAEVADRRVSNAIGRSVADCGFVLQRRVIELSGLCTRCRPAKTRSGTRVHGSRAA
ncbi:MAG: Fur family transcriptional regulator [Burkholderiales bacterium]|nr:Fur family transcriptional regulator [Burkholderiales bacterium]